MVYESCTCAFPDNIMHFKPLVLYKNLHNRLLRALVAWKRCKYFLHSLPTNVDLDGILISILLRVDDTL